MIDLGMLNNYFVIQSNKVNLLCITLNSLKGPEHVGVSLPLIHARFKRHALRRTQYQPQRSAAESAAGIKVAKRTRYAQ